MNEQADFAIGETELAALFASSTTRILDVVDAQVDFMWQAGALGIHPANGSREDASAIIKPMNRFFAALPDGAFDLAVVKFDTHFKGEYAKSPERELFPTIHCEFGTPGWGLAVDVAPLTWKFPTYIMAKNEFDMWGHNPTGVARHEIAFASDREEQAYGNLFKAIRLNPGDCPATRLATASDGVPRDRFLASDLTGTVVVLGGVASDFCDRQALLGYLARGAAVVVAEDLTAGIGGPGSPVPESGNMRDVIAATLRDHPDYTGKLYAAKSVDIMQVLSASICAPVGMPGKPAAVKRAHEYGKLICD